MHPPSDLALKEIRQFDESMVPPTDEITLKLPLGAGYGVIYLKHPRMSAMAEKQSLLAILPNDGLGSFAAHDCLRWQSHAGQG
jgi:hypothetical protein